MLLHAVLLLFMTTLNFCLDHDFTSVMASVLMRYYYPRHTFWPGIFKLKKVPKVEWVLLESGESNKG